MNKDAIDKAISLDRQIRQLSAQIDGLRAERNALIGYPQKRGKPYSGEERRVLLERALLMHRAGMSQGAIGKVLHCAPAGTVPNAAEYFADQSQSGHELHDYAKQIMAGYEPPPPSDIVPYDLLEPTTPLKNIELSTRVRNSLVWLQLSTLQDLANVPESELRELPNFGKKSMNEVKEVLAFASRPHPRDELRWRG